MPQPTITFEMALGNNICDVAGNVICDVAGNPILDLGLVDVFSEARAEEGITLEQGVGGNGFNERVGEPGVIEATMKNAGGEYTPGGANVYPRFEEGLSVKLGLSYGGTTRYTRGRLRYISPDAGSYGRRGCEIMAYDYMLEMAKSHPRQIPVQLSQRDDQLIQTVLDNVPNAPLATDLATGPDTYDYAFQNLVDEETYALGVMQAIAQSGLGHIFVQSDSDYGETLVYQSRHSRLENQTTVAALSDTMEDVKVERDETKRARKVTVYVNPVRLDSAATTVLYSSESELTFAPGETKTFTAYYRDPNGEDVRVAGVEMVTPVASTDYKFSSTSGSGEDLNGDLVVSVVFGGNSARVTMTNNAAVAGYLWHRQLRGKGVYIYERSSRSAENEDLLVGEEINFLLPYNDSLDLAQDFANVLLEWWGDEIATVDYVEFDAAKSEALLNAMLDGDVGELVTLAESQSGLSGNFYIQHRKIGPFDGTGKLPVVWHVTPAQFMEAFVLDSPTNAQLDSTAILAL